VKKKNILQSSIGGAALVVIISFFVWLATIDKRIYVIESTREVEKEARRQVDTANDSAVARIEHEREANDARVRDDLREIRRKVFQ
jgi:hypothetical protein